MEDRRRKFVYDEAGLVCGYQCAFKDGNGEICGDLIRTAAGLSRHLSRKHGINKQQEMFEAQDYHPNLDCYEPVAA